MVAITLLNLVHSQFKKWELQDPDPIERLKLEFGCTLFALVRGISCEFVHRSISRAYRRSTNSHERTRTKMRTSTITYLLVLAVLCPHLSPRGLNLDSVPIPLHAQAPASIIKIGAFSNMRYTSEHAYGYKAELWREQDRIFGFFLWSEGLIGDTPTGLLEDVRYDRRTGNLSFIARLTTGLFSNRQFSRVPSRDVVRFRGTLKGRHLRGTLEVSNALTPEDAPKREKIALILSKRESEVMIDADSYDAWKLRADEILKFRGPKW